MVLKQDILLLGLLGDRMNHWLIIHQVMGVHPGDYQTFVNYKNFLNICFFIVTEILTFHYFNFVEERNFQPNLL